VLDAEEQAIHVQTADRPFAVGLDTLGDCFIGLKKRIIGSITNR
jgi:hypothetical protein